MHRDSSVQPPYEEIVAFATRAPSVHNTQPWLWRSSASGLELLADWSRQLSRADPDGRDLLVSCGAALHHLRVAAEALGWVADVVHGPTSGHPNVLASITFTRGNATAATARRLVCLMDRQTDRRPFSSWPVPDQQLVSMAATGSEWGAAVSAVEDESVRRRLLVLTAEADRRQQQDPAYLTELATWARDREPSRDGVPPGNRPTPTPSAGAEVPIPQRFSSGMPIDLDPASEGSLPALFVIATSSDDVLSRVRAGEALSALWLDATDRGLVGVPLSQATEVDETRNLLQTGPLRDRACPQILFCVGWPALDREPLPPTPRRPVVDVLLRA
jgi:nitroreductase